MLEFHELGDETKCSDKKYCLTPKSEVIYESVRDKKKRERKSNDHATLGLLFLWREIATKIAYFRRENRDILHV